MRRHAGHMSALLSTRNAAFAKLLAQIIRLRAHYPDHLIKSIRLDNAGEFTSKLSMTTACLLGLMLSIQFPMCIPRMVSQRLPLNEFKWSPGHWSCAPIFLSLPGGMQYWHAAMLIRLRPTATQAFSAQQLVTGYEPSISHLRIFGLCPFYVPITPPQRLRWVLRDEWKVADSLPDAFSDLAKVTRSHIPAANVPARMESA
ncbi:hypothetical protein M0R45_018198 [Rubus argutus]